MEDAQPNEKRPARKGVHVVPTVRTTRQIASYRGAYCGRRGVPTGSNRYHNSREIPSGGSTSLQNSGRGYRPYSKPPSSHPSQRRIWSRPSAQDTQPQTFVQPVHPSTSIRKPKPMNENLILDLPAACQKGYEGNRRNRAAWIKDRISALEQQSNVKVIDYSYLENKIMFRVQRRPPAPPPTFTDLSTTALRANPGSSSLAVKTEPSPGHALMKATLPIATRPMTDSPLPKVMNVAASTQCYAVADVKVESCAPRADIENEPTYDTHARNSERMGASTVPSTRSSSPARPDRPFSSPPNAISRVMDHGLQPNEGDVEHDPPREQISLYGCFSCRSGKFVVKLQHGLPGLSTENVPQSKEPFSPQARDSETPIMLSTSIRQWVPQQERKDDTDTEVIQDLLDIPGQKFSASSLFEPCQAVSLPKYDKPRRLLELPHGDLLCVTAHGLMDRFKCGYERRRLRFLDENKALGHIEDACLIKTSKWGSCVVIGHARNYDELSLLRVEETETVTLANCTRLGGVDKRHGISVVSAMIQSSMFATGGYDHRVHLWTISEDFTLVCFPQLDLRHKSMVQALLAVSDSSEKLLTAGADCVINVWDVHSERLVNTLNISNSPYQVHATDLPSCALFEVAHRELQFEMRDWRATPLQPVQRFGYSTSHFHGRYSRGDLDSFYFACGGRDGVTRLWDLRATAKPCEMIPCFPDSRVVEVVFSKGRLIACSSDYRIAAVNLSPLY